MRKKLTLSRKNKIIAGVCGGLGDYFNIDPTIVRLIFVAVGCISHIWPILLAYIVCWAIFPSEM